MTVDPLDPSKLICYECNSLLDDIDGEWNIEDEEDDDYDFDQE